MDFSRARCPKWLLLITVVASTSAQIPSARAILDLSESDQSKFVSETMDAGFPDDRADQMTMLVLNRSALVVPLLQERVKAELGKPSPSNKLIATATEMIAYAGNEQSLRAINRLITIDAERFAHLVERTLDNAIDFRNPFTVAYQGLEVSDQGLSERIGRWAADRSSTQRMQRLWAEAMLDKYNSVPTDRQWTQDILAIRSGKSRSTSLKDSVTGFAKQTQERRRRSQ